MITKFTFDKFGRPFLRVIIADDNNKFPWDEGCMEEYKVQFSDEEIKKNEYIMSM
jgi:hypothetical protein